MPSTTPGGESDRTQQVLTPAAAATPVIDCNLGLDVDITMPAGNITLGAPINPMEGMILTTRIKQDGVGSRTVAVNAVFKRAGGTWTLTTTAGATDVITWRYDKNTGFWTEIGRALAVA